MPISLLSRCLWALCSFALLGSYNVSACTSGGNIDPKLGYVTWRTFDLPLIYLNSWAFVPAGTKMSLLPVAGREYSTLGDRTLVKHSFVCYTPTHDILDVAIAASDLGLVLDPEIWPGYCLEGYNHRSLHVSALMQRSSTGINKYSGSGPAIEQLDLVQYLLARYEDVAAVWADLEDGKLNPVMNPALEFVTKITFASNYSTVHYNIRDSTGRSMVLEYGGPNNLQWWDTTEYTGALANNPMWEDQTAYYTNYWETNDNPYLTMHGSKFLNLAGSYNSSHRFLRAAKLPEAGSVWQWPKFIEISPYYPPEGGPETNPVIMAAMDVMHATYLPKGIDDAGGRQCFEQGCETKRDITWIVHVADHRLRHYYYRVASSPQWKRIAMNEVNWDSMHGCIHYMKIRATKWWVDESNDYRRDAHADGITAAPFMLEQFQRDLELLLAGKDPWV